MTFIFITFFSWLKRFNFLYLFFGKKRRKTWIQMVIMRCIWMLNRPKWTACHVQWIEFVVRAQIKIKQFKPRIFFSWKKKCAHINYRLILLCFMSSWFLFDDLWSLFRRSHSIFRSGFWKVLFYGNTKTTPKPDSF